MATAVETMRPKRKSDVLVRREPPYRTVEIVHSKKSVMHNKVDAKGKPFCVCHTYRAFD